MTVKIPLINSQKTKEIRQVNIFLPLPSGKKINGIRNNLTSGISNLNHKTLKKLEILNKYSSKQINRISITNGPYIRKDGNYHDEILAMIKGKKLRILVLLTSLEGNLFQADVREDVLNNNNISHLVEIEPISKHAEWIQSGFNFSSAKVMIQGDDYKIVLNLIEDIILDISMFYAYFKENEFVDDILFKRLISRKKVEFAIKYKLKNPYGVLASGSKYYSLASTCRGENDFQYKLYHKLWEEFLDFLNSTEDLILKNAQTYIAEIERELNKSKDKHVSQIIKTELKKWQVFTKKIEPKSKAVKTPKAEGLNKLEQFKLHKDYGEISLNKLKKLIENLEEGVYILARTTKRPKQNKYRKTILNTMGVGSRYWQKGYLKVFPFSYYDNLVKYTPHISLFKFYIKNGKK